MEYRQLGKSGVQASVIGLGTNQFGGKVDQAGVEAIIDTAVDLGINFIDTANVYQEGRSEETLGRALRGRWHQVLLATKAYFPVGEGPNERGASRYHLRQAVENSLRRLQTDHIDLYQMHRWDQRTPIEETLRALDELVRAGKVRYIGASGYAAWQLAHANLLAEVKGWEPFITIQPHYHMLEREIERELIPYCNAFGLGILPYFPLAGGFLTGKYRRDEPAPKGARGETSQYVQKYMTEANFDRVEKLQAWATERDRSMVHLAHAWLLAQPQVSSVISGVTRIDQLKENAGAHDWVLSPKDVADIDDILAG
jgi:aryl-alcohol dehydrogenase-like predicted oxidoreductase